MTKSILGKSPTKTEATQYGEKHTYHTTLVGKNGQSVSIDSAYPMLQFVGLDMVDVLVGQNYTTMGTVGVETLYKLIVGAEVDLGDENNFIDTGYEVVDKTNYEEILASKDPW